jgi:putative phosphoesterase
MVDVTMVLVVSDTHLTGATLDRMPAEVWAMADEADVVLHVGDVLDAAVIDAFSSHAPVHAVLGNNDRTLVGVLPEALELTLGGVRVAMVHDSGPTAGRPRRLTRRFPDAQVILFGHSHHPVVEHTDGGVVLMNPGSPTQRRREPVHTVGRLELVDGAVAAAWITEVGPLASPTRAKLTG